MAHARMHENESMNILAPLDDEQPAVGGFNSSHACPNFGDTTVPPRIFTRHQPTTTPRSPAIPSRSMGATRFNDDRAPQLKNVRHLARIPPPFFRGTRLPFVSIVRTSSSGADATRFLPAGTTGRTADGTYTSVTPC